MQTKLILSVIGMSFIGLLSGCSSLNSNFDCPKKPGVMCKSLDQVNTMVDQGEVGHPSETNFSAKETKASSLMVASNNESMRTHDKVARIWIAPFEDSDGDYYQATTVYHVIQPGEWVNSPATEME